MGIFKPITEYFSNVQLVFQDYDALKQKYHKATDNFIAARNKIYYEEDIPNAVVDDAHFKQPDLPETLAPRGKGCMACFQQKYITISQISGKPEYKYLEYPRNCQNFKPTSWELPLLDFAASYEENERMEKQYEGREESNSEDLRCADKFCTHVKNNWDYYEMNKLRVLAKKEFMDAKADLWKNLKTPAAYRREKVLKKTASR